MELLVFKVYRENADYKENEVHLVLKEIREKEDHKVLQVFREIKDPLVLKESPDKMESILIQKRSLFY
jgi:hypothetical protein